MSQHELQCEEALEWLAIEAIEGPGEREAALDAHCATCPSCAAARNDYRRVASMLVYGLPQTPAGPEVRERLRLRVALTPAGRSSRWRRWPVIAGSGIAAAVALGAGIALWRANENGGGANQPAAAVQDHTEWYELLAAEAGGGATGGITIDPDQRSASLIAKHLPALDTGKVYEFWFLLQDGTRLPVYRFYPMADGTVQHSFPLPDGAKTLAGVWVTLESEGEWDGGPGPNVLIARFPDWP